VEAPAPLKQPAFRSLWLAGLVSEAGDWLLFIALPIVVYRLTGSALGTSFAFLAQLAPAIMLAPLAGRLADRHDRRVLMLGICGLQAISLLPLLWVDDHSGLPIVYAVIVTQSALTTLFDPAKNALLPTLVNREQLVAANSLVALNDGVARLVGGPLGGLLLAAGDLRTIVVADAVSYAVAATLIARVPGAAPPPAVSAAPGEGATGGGPFERPPAGRRIRFRAVLRHRSIRRALGLTFFADIAQGIFLVLFIVFVAQRLHGGAGETGLLRGVQAVGAIAAGLALATIARRRSPVRMLAGAAIAFGVISLLVWNLPVLTTAPAVYAVLFALVGAPGVVFSTGLITFLQQAGDSSEHGRIFGALGLAENAGQAVGMIAAGALAGPLGLGTMLNIQAGIYLATGLVAVRALQGATRRVRPQSTCVSAVSAGRPK
jgi:Na+/melibiose symporter-like transporter